MTFPKALLAPVLAVALLSSACAPAGNVAARVGDRTVSIDDVDLLARVQCTLGSSQPGGAGGQVATPKRVLRNQSLDALVDLALFKEVDARRGQGYDATTYRAQMDQLRPRLAHLGASDEKRATDILSDYWKGILVLQRLAENDLHDIGVAKPSQAQVDKQVQKIYRQARSSVDVEVNPAFGPDDTDMAGTGDGSVSKPVSTYAKQAASGNPDADYVAGLPASMRCG